MDSKYILGPNGELYHWGTKGMKWGIRRYQNKDGSLTPAGRKRYAAENEKLKAREKAIKGREKAAARQAKLDAKKAELDAREAALKNKKKPVTDTATEKPKVKSFRDMSDDELREYTTRMQLEKQYIEAQKNLNAAMPQKTSKGKQFMESLVKDVVAPAAKNAGKEYLEKVMKDKLGLNKKDPDSLKELEAEYKKLEWRTKIADLNKAGTLKEQKDKSVDWNSELKRQEYEENERSRAQKEFDRETERIRNEIERSKAERGRMKEEMAYEDQQKEYEEWRKKRQGQGGS